MDADEKYMWLALDLARQGTGRTSPNPMVGAVIVKDGEIIGTGYHEGAGRPHAEVNALEVAGERARGATLYVNLEPCVHQGRTPPCTEKIIAAGLRKVVVSMVDPNPLVGGRGIEELSRAGLKVKTGVLEEKAHKLNEVFVKYITTGLPFILMKTAMSLDGKTATREGYSRWISSERSREHVHRVRDQVDAIMVGVGTVLKDNPRLTTRLEGQGEVRNPVRVIVDSQGRLPLDCRVARTAGGIPTILAVTEKAPREKIQELKGLGVEVFMEQGRQGQVDLGALMKYLGEKEITSVLVEGGSTLNFSLLQEGLPDKVMFYIAPLVIGGSSSPTPVGGQGVALLEDAWKIKGLEVRTMGEDIILSGYLDWD